MNRDREATREDLTFLADHGVGATNAAERAGFTDVRALDKWMRRHDLVPLLNRLTALDFQPLGQPRFTIHRKACTGCGETKALSEFYEQRDAKDGRASQCRKCNNTRRPTEARLLRNRARTRAVTLLVAQHRDEFEQLCDTAYAAVQAEHARIVQAAETAGNADGTTARLKPGPRRQDETDVVQRLDVARCPTCHTHHDAGHECPHCGDTTPATAPAVKPHEIRAWAQDHGIACPTRGPLPERVVALYAEQHDQSEAS